MSSNADPQLSRIFDFLQANRYVRIAIGTIIVGVLVLFAGRSAYRLLPHHYVLTLTGGDIVSNRHHLARVLQAEAPKYGLTLVVEPVSNGLDALERVSQGKLDVALVQGGFEQSYPNVEHVATVMPELVHLLVKPGIHGMGDLKGRSVNMGIKNSASRWISLTLLRFAGYEEDVDYVETNYTAEQLLALPLRKMPDAILTVSSVPSYLVEILVRKHRYQVMEIPFPESFALRHGWAANGLIRAYTYDLVPVVPERDIATVAVNMHLVANAAADPGAIAKLLEVLYSPAVENRLLRPVDPKLMMIPSGFPLSAGATEYLHRDDVFLTVDLWRQAQGVFGLVMSFAGMVVVLVRWLRGKREEFADAELHGYLAEVVAVEKRLMELREGSKATEVQATQALCQARQRLCELRILLLERYPKAKLEDSRLLDRCLATVRAAQDEVRRLLEQAEVRP